MAKYKEIAEVPSRIFAIGDVHACAAELATLIDHLKLQKGIGQGDLVVFIGDYIDRGPDSKGVIEQLIEFRKGHENSVFLRGNHEDMLLGYLGYEGHMGEAYLHNGGAECLASYNLSVDQPAEEVLAKLPPEHLSFFLELESYVLVGEYVFAHAGLHPLRPLEAQLDRDLFWIRDEFIQNVHRFGKTIVFGHTPYQDVMFHLPFKIGIDTGLVYGNMLSCIELVGMEVYQVERGEDKVKESSLSQRAEARR